MLTHYCNKYAKNTLLLNSLFLIAMTTYGQGTSIKGTIRDASTGRNISNVTVKVKGSSASTQSNAGGSFTIQANIGNTLIISSVGYQEKEVIVPQGDCRCYAYPI